MKIDYFPSNVFIGFALAALSAATFYILSVFFPGFIALRLVISMVTLVYIGYLMLAINIKAGKMALPVTAIGVMAFAFFGGISLPLYLALHLFVIWLVRVIYLHRPLIACLDFFASGASAVLAYLALSHTHSLFIAIWSFFLLQSVVLSTLFYIDGNLYQRRDSEPLRNEKFSRALRTAEGAFKRLNVN